MIKKVLNDYQILIENHIEKRFPQSDTLYKEVSKASRYSLLLGGKRIRPVLMLEFAKLFGCEDEAVLDFAVALEMIHTYSLIHDDLPCMDNDDMRRGKPSCHKKFGEDIALLAGDTLLTESFKIAANSSADDMLKAKAILVLASRAGLDGMIGGQVMDLLFEERKPDKKELEDMYSKKTGALLSAATEIGCILGGADDNDIKLASKFALKLGLAFQIIDDILDIIGDEQLLGKPIGSDAENNKTTIATLLGVTNAKSYAEELTDEALSILSQFNGDITVLKALTEFLLNRNF